MGTTHAAAKPFLKWAGGKGRLLPQLDRHFPTALKTGQIDRYVEPFVGSGAVFLYVAQTYSVSEFWIADVNPELVLAYRTIREAVEATIARLQALETAYLRRDVASRKAFYYHVRSQFNAGRALVDPSGDFTQFGDRGIDRTVQLIFLNRTCFNGLFRVNSRGEFNVPAGRYKNPRICHADNLRRVSDILQRTTIHQGDFQTCADWVGDRSFVYFDPPYKPLSKTANFIEYASGKFDDGEQLRLRDFYRQLDRRGAKLMLSNSDPTNADAGDRFFDLAYADYRIERVRAARNINSNAAKRGDVREVLILNYDRRSPA